jgi:hypothetical protein
MHYDDKIPVGDAGRIQHVIDRTRQRLGVRITADTVQQMADAVVLGKAEFIGHLPHGREQHRILIGYRSAYLVFDRRGNVVVTVCASPDEVIASQQKRKQGGVIFKGHQRDKDQMARYSFRQTDLASAAFR